MALLKFLKGNYSNLNNAAITEGQVLICGDTGEMFVDVAANKRVKIGDFTVIANIAALEALDATSVPTSRLYYVEDGNILARSNGTTWIQVNKQPTTEELKTLLGLGSAAYTDADAYDAAGSAKAVRDYVGEIPENYTEQTVIAYINKKAEETLNTASGGTSESAASVKAALETYKSENDPKVTANTNAIAAIKDGTTIDSFADVESGLDGKVDKVTGKSLVADTEITKLAGVSEGANKVEASATNGNIKIDGQETTVYTHPGQHQISEINGLDEQLIELGLAAELAKTAIQEISATDNSVEIGYRENVESWDGGVDAHYPTVKVNISKSSDNALSLADDGLKVVIPDAAEYSIVKAADSGEYAAIYNLTKDGTIVGASINIPKDLVVRSGSVIGDEIVLVLNDEANTEIKIPVGSLIEYVTSGSTTGDMIVINVSDDHKVTATITDGTVTLAKLTTEVQTAIGKAHDHSNKAVIDGITAQNITDWNDAVSKEHTHENKELLDTYTQTEVDLADAVTKKHSHANATVLDGITAEKVSAWDSSEQNAKDYIEELLSWGTF